MHTVRRIPRIEHLPLHTLQPNVIKPDLTAVFTSILFFLFEAVQFGAVCSISFPRLVDEPIIIIIILEYAALDHWYTKVLSV